MYYLKNIATIIIVLSIISCEESDNPLEVTPINATELSNLNQVTDNEGNAYSVGFDQVSGINQNPFVKKKDSDGNQIWRVIYENTAVDGRANLITLDNSGRPWVIFSVDGGSNSDEYIDKKEVFENAFSNVYMSGYGSGGGAKVSIIARLNPENGKIEKGTFITARLSSGNTNSLNITKIGFKNDLFAFETSTAAWPPYIGKSFQQFPDITNADRIENAFKIYYEMKSDLSEVTSAVLMTE